MAVERTFWGKATILHAEHYRPKGKATGGRISRHYYDLAMLSRSRHAADALERVNFLEIMAKYKALFFRSIWARYVEAKPGTLRLMPAEARLGDLAVDYVKMSPMFFGQPPSFRELLADIEQLEHRINERGS